MATPKPEELETALASLSRMAEANKACMRQHFIEGISLPRLAASTGKTVEALANTARRVRARLANPFESGLVRQENHASPLVLQIQKCDLERAFAVMPRTGELTKKRVRQFFYDGQSAAEIAREDKVSVETVHNAVRRVRMVLAEQLSPWTVVGVQVVAPVALAQTFQSLCSELAQTTNRDFAEEVMKITFDNLAYAREAIKNGALER